MIPPALIDKIRRLVATRSYSLRQIARLTGVSRGTVAAVARGKRADPQAAPRGHREAPRARPRRSRAEGGPIASRRPSTNLRKNRSGRSSAARSAEHWATRRAAPVPCGVGNASIGGGGRRPWPANCRSWPWSWPATIARDTKRCTHGG
jgi:hypothetical protein